MPCGRLPTVPQELALLHTVPASPCVPSSKETLRRPGGAGFCCGCATPGRLFSCATAAEERRQSSNPTNGVLFPSRNALPDHPTSRSSAPNTGGTAESDRSAPRRSLGRRESATSAWAGTEYRSHCARSDRS